MLGKVVAPFVWVRGGVPGFRKVGVFQKIPHSFAVTSAALAKAEVGLQVSLYSGQLGNKIAHGW